MYNHDHDSWIACLSPISDENIAIAVLARTNTNWTPHTRYTHLASQTEEGKKTILHRILKMNVIIMLLTVIQVPATHLLLVINCRNLAEQMGNDIHI